MKTVFLCALGKLRRKKVPHLLLGICILITTALLGNALILLNQLNAIFDRAYEEMAGPHLCCLWSKEVIPTDTVQEYLKGWQENLTFQITENTKTIDYIEKDGRKLSNGILLELPKTIHGDRLSPKMLGSKALPMPGENEIWVTTKMAQILGVKTGDHVVLQLADASVRVAIAGIVSDPVFGGSSTNVYRMWCGSGQLSRFPLAENNGISYLEIRFQEYGPQTEADFIRAAEESFQVPLSDTIYTYDRIKGGYTAPYQMVGAVLCLVSAILAGTILALLLFLIRSDMEEDVRIMGIYKTLGMTQAQIAGIYLVCYGVVGAVGASLGSLLGGLLSKGVLTKVLGDMGLYKVPFGKTGIYQAFAGILVLAAGIVICLCAIFKIRKLQAACAIRTGTWQWQTRERHPKKRKDLFLRGISSFELYYAVRGIRNKKLPYGYIAGVSLILGSLTILSLGCLHAVKNIDQEPELWGFIKSDIYVTSMKATPVSDIIEELEGDPRVLYTYGVNKVTSQYKPAHGQTWQNIPTEVYQLPWKDEVKDRSLYGRRPLQEYEVGIGLALSQAYGFKVGDSMELLVNGKKASYEITGIFQTLSNYGNVIRTVTNDLDEFMKSNDSYADYMLVLAHGVDKWEYAQELAEKYDGKFSFIAAKSNGENISGILAPAFGTILTVLFLVSILITINLTFLLIRREQNLIGLLKAVGMTSWQIVKIYSFRNGLSALAGNSLGLLLGIFVIPRLLTPYARFLGLSEFPFGNSLSGTAISFLLLPVCTVLGTWAIVKAIGSVSVKQLVRE
ncbi:MAG: FtsX-like permease family protein [Lachnospiraceae bacterium]|nr:FtsX-like permease family protein [Lachnospiraceae bacterium]